MLGGCISAPLVGGDDDGDVVPRADRAGARVVGEHGAYGTQLVDHVRDLGGGGDAGLAFAVRRPKKSRLTVRYRPDRRIARQRGELLATERRKRLGGFEAADCRPLYGPKGSRPS